MTVEVTFEREGGEKPVCVAETLARVYTRLAGMRTAGPASPAEDARGSSPAAAHARAVAAAAPGRAWRRPSTQRPAQPALDLDPRAARAPGTRAR